MQLNSIYEKDGDQFKLSMNQGELLHLIARLSSLAERAPAYPTIGNYEQIGIGHVDSLNRYRASTLTVVVTGPSPK